MEKKKRNIIIATSFIVVIIAVVAVMASTPTLSPLERDFEWFREHGYLIHKVNYMVFLESLPSEFDVNEIEMSKSEFRAKAEALAHSDLTYGVGWCEELNMLYIAYPSETKNIVDVFYWTP